MEEQTQQTMTEQAVVQEENVETPADQQEEQDYLSEFVGEGKKYATVEEAAKALAKKAVNADQHINTLIEEKRQQELEIAKAKSVEDILSAIRGNPDTPVQPPSVSEETPSQPGQPVDIEAAVKQYMEKTEQQKQQAAAAQAAQQNQEKAWSLLTEKYGTLEGAKEAIRSYAGGDKAKASIIDVLANSNPEELVRIVSSTSKAPESPVDIPKGLRLSEDSPIVSGLTWAKAKQVKKENPKLYNSPQFQQKLHEAAAKLGDKFYN